MSPDKQTTGKTPDSLGRSTVKAGPPEAAADVLDRREALGSDDVTLPPVRRTAADPVVLKDTGAFRSVRQRTFGRFELLIEMGQGGMATLYLARIRGPRQFEKLVAVKKIHDHLSRQDEFVNMFLDEARIAAMIDHPNVANIFDLGRVEGSHFIAMEYVHGQNLTDILKAARRHPELFPWSHAARIVADAAAGLHAAHELHTAEGRFLNVVHRDVSPQNILISYDGNVKVVDFGVAYAAEKLVDTASGTLKGKAAYMSPEQTMDEPIDRRSDVFSLGIVLFESILLRRLFKAKTDAMTLLKVREAKVPRLRDTKPEIPQTLEDIMLKALAKDPADRFQSAAEMSERLQEMLAREGKTTSPQKLARMMEDFFYDRKELKEQQIQYALGDEGGGTVRGVGMSGSSSASLKMPEYSGKVRARRRRKRMLTGGAVAGAAALVVVAVWAYSRFFPLRGGGAKRTGTKAAAVPARAEPRARPRPPEPPKTSKVTVRVAVEPAEAAATVLFRGKEYPGGAFQAVVPRSGRPEEIEVRAPGYVTRRLTVVPTADSTLKVLLEPEPRKPRARRKKRSRKKPPPLRELP